MTSLRPHIGALQSEQGFTLIELLIASILALIVAGGLMSFVIVSLHQENAVSSAAFASQRAQTGLRQLTQDLVQAQNIPDSSATTGNDTPVVISYTATTFSAALYVPIPGSTSAGTKVVWTCTAQTSSSPGSCTRTAGSTTATEINGVISASITPTDSTGSTVPSCGGDPTGTGTPLPVCGSIVQSGNPLAKFPSLVALSLQVSDISQADSSQTHTVAGTTNGETFNTSIDLRNYT
jgi:prepilin-type N-terminal cleavage/methylation domain-containing protein